MIYLVINEVTGFYVYQDRNMVLVDPDSFEIDSLLHSLKNCANYIFTGTAHASHTVFSIEKKCIFKF